ncbi:hypothetical protein [Morganella morganii IS15]|nr:hypothetical protein [Morganella morganii IS15]
MFVALRHTFSDKALSTDWQHPMNCFSSVAGMCFFPGEE